MMEQYNRSVILERLREKIAAGRPILCAGAGDPATAANLEKAGSDLIFITNGLRFNKSNAVVYALLPYSNANNTIREMGEEILPAIKYTPVIAGVCATDPGYGRAHFLRQLHNLGFAGIQNDPSLGLLDGEYRNHLESSGMCYSQEVDCISSARSMEILAVGNAFSTDEARAMMKAGADIILAHLELFPAIGERNDSIPRIQELAAVCKAFGNEVIILVRTAPGTSFDTLQKVLDSCPNVAGFQLHLRMADFSTDVAFVRELVNYKKLSLPTAQRQLA